MVGKIKRRSLKITYLLAAFLGWTASAAIANAAPIFTFASFAMSGIDVTIMNVTVSGVFINGNGGANPNPCGTGVTNCAFMVSGNPYGAAAATNMTINSAASWNTVSNRVGLGPDKQYGTADDVHLAVNSTFGYEPTQVAGDFLAPSLQNPFVGTHFTMSLRSTTHITGCTTSVTTCLQGFDTGFVNFQLTAAQMAAPGQRGHPDTRLGQPVARQHRPVA